MGSVQIFPHDTATMGEFNDKAYITETEALFKRFPSVQVSPLQNAYKPGLERIIAFDELLGHPHKAFKSIHVAGTNGKGSVANMLASVLTAAGHRTGLFTSPHILDFRERMRVAQGDGRGCIAHKAPKEYVLNFIERWRPDFERLELSFFEITTGMAFKWFADMGADTAVIEVGLGGRLDSTNIITPILSIVTGIGLDHCQQLGYTLSEIASEKAGIFKENVPALVGEVLPETEPIFKAKASSTHSQLHFAQRMIPTLWDSREFLLRNMDLQGEFQQKNLLTVLSAMDILCQIQPGLIPAETNVSGALIHTAERMDFHGRWERISDHPHIICDIGHNAHALKNNFSQLERMLEKGECSSLIIVYAVMADKDLDAIMPLMPHNASYIFTAPATQRALPADELLKRYLAYCKKEGLNTGRLYSSENVSKALSMATMLAAQTNPRQIDRKAPEPIIYIGGSTYLVSEAVPLLRPEGKSSV